jgi:hypothetical protein
VKSLSTELISNLRKHFRSSNSKELTAHAKLLDSHFKRRGSADDQKLKAAFDGLVRGINIMSVLIALDSLTTVTTTHSKISEEIDNKIKKLTVESNPSVSSSNELDKDIAEAMLPRTTEALN